jgi:hypothetical protein
MANNDKNNAKNDAITTTTGQNLLFNLGEFADVKAKNGEAVLGFETLSASDL